MPHQRGAKTSHKKKRIPFNVGHYEKVWISVICYFKVWIFTSSKGCFTEAFHRTMCGTWWRTFQSKTFVWTTKLVILTAVVDIPRLALTVVVITGNAHSLLFSVRGNVMLLLHFYCSITRHYIDLPRYPNSCTVVPQYLQTGVGCCCNIPVGRGNGMLIYCFLFWSLQCLPTMHTKFLESMSMFLFDSENIYFLLNKLKSRMFVCLMFAK